MNKIVLVNFIILAGVMNNVHCKPANYNLEVNEILMFPSATYNTNNNNESDKISPKHKTHGLRTSIQNVVTYHPRTKKPISTVEDNNVPQESPIIKIYKTKQNDLMTRIKDAVNYHQKTKQPISRTTEENNNIPQESATVNNHNNKIHKTKPSRFATSIYNSVNYRPKSRNHISSSTNNKKLNFPTVQLAQIPQEPKISSRFFFNVEEYSQKTNKVQHNIPVESTTVLSQEEMKKAIDDIFNDPIVIAPRFNTPAPIDDVILCSLLGGGCV